MLASTFSSMVRFLCLVFSYLTQAADSIRAWFRQTPARKLCQQSLSALFVAGASLLLLGNDSCDTKDNYRQFTYTMSDVADIFRVHYVTRIAKSPGHANRVSPRIQGSDGSTTGTADFSGNFTTIQGPAQGTMVMAREADCSLGLVTVASNTDPGTITQHYEQLLHQAAGLTTTPDVYAQGCADSSIGISSRPGVFVGKTTSGVLVFAAAGANSNNNAVFLYNSNNSLTETTVTTVPYASSLATADLNGDQNNDLVVVNGATTGGATVSVMLANADGTFQSPVVYNVAGAAGGTEQFTATIDDVNNDGKLDIITVSADQQVSVLPGKGDGTFGSALSFAAPAVPGSAQSVISNIITADVNGDGKKDLVCSNGLVLVGAGDGTFTAASAAAFPYLVGVSNEGPNLAAGDLNNDGKIDLVVNTGAAVYVSLGKGDGSFTAGNTYASINDTGFVTIADLDGDGNADVYVGLADNGIYGGDDSNSVLAYALMGNGDGSFRGAPLAPATYSGNDLVDLNGDGYPDLVSNGTGLFANDLSGAFTVALGSKTGNFDVKGTVAAPDTFSLSGYSFSGAASVPASGYAVADVNGDNKPDLVFAVNNLTATGSSSTLAITYPYPVYFVSLGNGDGTFGVAKPYAFPQIAPASGFDNSLTVMGMQIADFNKDGHADLVLTYNDIAGGPGVTNPYLQGLVVLAGKGDGTFGNSAILTSTYAGTSAPASALASTITEALDINGDGTPDLVATVPSFSIATGATVALGVYLGNGDGTFKTLNTVNIAANVYGFPVVADLNGDSKLDLAFIAETSAGNGEIGIALGNGDGTFANATTIALADGDEIRSDGLAAADFNGDGHADLALIDSIDYGGIFYGKGDGTFTSVPVNNFVVPKDLLNLNGGAPAVAADLNGDGKPDVLAGNVVLLGEAAPTIVTTPTASTTTTLKASPTTITAGASVTFTATVAPGSGSGTPTGTVTFLNGTTTLGTGTLSASGVATYATTTLPTGSDSITASYGGDSNFSGSTSSAVTVTVNAVVVNPSFALSNSGNITVSPGATSGNTSTISVTGAGGFSAPVALTCAVTPAAASDPATCSLSPASVTVSGTTAQTSTLTITTTAPASAQRANPAGGGTRWYSAAGATLACVLLCGIPARRRRWQNLLGVLILLVLSGITFAGCGGGSSNSGGGGGTGKTTGDAGTTAGTYTVTVTGTSGGTTAMSPQTTTVSVVVN